MRGGGPRLRALPLAGLLGALLSCSASSPPPPSGLDALPWATVAPETLPLAVAAVWPGEVSLSLTEVSPAPTPPSLPTGFYVASPNSLPLAPPELSPRSITLLEGCPIVSCDGVGCPISADAVTASPPLPYAITYRADSGPSGCLLTTPCPPSRNATGLCTVQVLGGWTIRYQASATPEQWVSFSRHELLTQVDPDDGNTHKAVAASTFHVIAGSLDDETFSGDEETSAGEFLKTTGRTTWSAPGSDAIAFTEEVSISTPTGSAYRRVSAAVGSIQRDASGLGVSLLVNGTFLFGADGPGVGWGARGRIRVQFENLLLQLCPGRGEVPNGGTIEVTGAGQAVLNVHTNCDGAADIEVNGALHGVFSFASGGGMGEVRYAPPTGETGGKSSFP